MYEQTTKLNTWMMNEQIYCQLPLVLFPPPTLMETYRTEQVQRCGFISHWGDLIQTECTCKLKPYSYLTYSLRVRSPKVQIGGPGLVLSLILLCVSGPSSATNGNPLLLLAVFQVFCECELDLQRQNFKSNQTRHATCNLCVLNKDNLTVLTRWSSTLNCDINYWVKLPVPPCG